MGQTCRLRLLNGGVNMHVAKYQQSTQAPIPINGDLDNAVGED